ncbi:MAG TPA: hypothetical protein VJ875_26870 [Pyrinomonadaceae bacterium]|nr:hypothetical protein [Pyrinomonadaceae bacterium]
MNVAKALQIIRKEPNNTTAWEVVVLAVYQPMLVYVASLLFSFRITAARDSVHDVVHDVLVRFYERWPDSNAEITSEAALNAYLRRSCRNLLVDRYRHEQHTGQFVDFLTVKFKDAFQESDVYSSILLKEIIEQMPPDCASLLKRFITEGLSPAEIADKEGMLPASFYTKWYRCIKRARTIFSENVKKKERLKR